MGYNDVMIHNAVTQRMDIRAFGWLIAGSNLHYVTFSCNAKSLLFAETKNIDIQYMYAYSK